MKQTDAIVNSRWTKSVVFGLCLCALLFFQGCNASMKNRVLGRSWTFMGGHEVVISPCYWPYRKSVESAQEATHQFTCGKTNIEIKNEELFVDGKSRGMLHKGDAVAIVSGKLLINSKQVEEVASK